MYKKMKSIYAVDLNNHYCNLILVAITASNTSNHKN